MSHSTGSSADFAAADRIRHLYLLHVVRVPLLRLTGFTLTVVAVALHNANVLHVPAADTWRLAGGLAVYCALSTLVLHFYYRRRSKSSIDLGWLFHVGDLLGCIAAVYASGGERSWLFFLLLLPVWNQTHFSARRSALSGATAITLYVALMLYLQRVEHRAVSSQLALFRTALLAIIATYAALSAAVVERSRERVARALREARGSTERYAERMAALNRMTQTVTSIADLSPMLDAVAEEMLSLLSASSCAITLLDKKSWTLEVAACRAVRAGAPDVRGFKIPVDQNPACNRAIDTMSPVVVRNAQTSPLTLVTHPALRALGVHCLMSVPIISHGDVIGTISIHTDNADRVFTAEETQLASMAARQVAAPIRNARLYEEEKRSRALAVRLQEAGRSITESLDLDDVLRKILDQLHEVVEFDAGSIQLLEGDAMRVIAVRGHDDREIGIVRPLESHGYNRRLATSPEPLIIGLPTDLDMWPKDDGASSEFRTVMGLPLIVHDNIIGAMSIDSRTPNAYSERDAEAAMAFARFASVAVEHARLYSSIVELAILDSLTGVANRRHFDAVLQTEWRRATRNHTQFSLMMIDVDDFKSYNDHYGHSAGDHVLHHVAQALRGSLQRAGDFIARYGGEEFVVLVPAADLSGASQHAEILRRRVEQLAIPHERAAAAPVVTISIGVATAFADNESGPASLLIAADQQLYEAKRCGRNRVAGTYVLSQNGERASSTA
jgi:diguanylate cyclase (GGDEF)-like protein